MRTCPLLAALLSLTTTFAAAQAPDVIYYTFNGGNAANLAVPSLGPGTPNAAVSFGPGFCGNGAAIVGAANPEIATGWQVDFGTGSWTIGMWIDLSAGTNAFQYFFGSLSTGGLRCFCNGAAGVNGVLLRTLGADVLLPGGAPSTGPTHCAWVYDSAAQEVRGHVNGVNVVTVAQASPLDINGTAADFNLMHYGSSLSMLVNNEMDDFRVYRRALSQAEVTAWVAHCSGIGASYCSPAVANSTGSPGVMSAMGSNVVANNDLSFIASGLPNNASGYFLTSMIQGFVPNPGGSQGTLCLAGAIGRYVGPGQIQNSGSTGQIMLQVNLLQHPVPTGPLEVLPGDMWNFQAWYRDSVGGIAVSNFTDAFSVTFQ